MDYFNKTKAVSYLVTFFEQPNLHMHRGWFARNQNVRILRSENEIIVYFDQRVQRI